MLINFHFTMLEIIERLENDNKILGRDNDNDLLLEELKIDLDIMYQMKREIEQGVGYSPPSESFGH